MAGTARQGIAACDRIEGVLALPAEVASDREPVVRRLIIEGFRSIRSEVVDFDNPTFLVGRNGSGKSNLVDGANREPASLAPQRTRLVAAG
jgi:hypothetical protein